MQFNSFIFILVFMPLTLIFYFWANKINCLFGKILLIIAGIVFYIYADIKTGFVLGFSLVVNFCSAKVIEQAGKKKHCFRWLCFFPVLVNILLLVYFKYTNFLIVNINEIFSSDFALQKVMLPIGISFYTFQQIAYVVSVYKREIQKVDWVDYLLYILYFPKLLMGPLMEPVDFLKQINDNTRKKVNWNNLACGIQILCFGLFKKMMIADIFEKAVSWGYSNMETTTSMDWLLIMVFYTFEIYFDFSGYSDMAVGSSLMLNITLPINFDSPYKALSIKEFWKRWHISLTGFFTKYIYIPLGGNRKGKKITYMNIMLVFLISGIWHGANWTFILWGVLHGIFMVLDRVFEKIESKKFKPVRWGSTFLIVNVLWLLFRSDSIKQWAGILKIIGTVSKTGISAGLVNQFILPESTFLASIFHLVFWKEHAGKVGMLLFIIGAGGICLLPENNYNNLKKISMLSMILSVISFIWAFICLSGESVFVYFNF